MTSPHIQRILSGLSAYARMETSSEQRGPAIHVHRLTGKAGAFYEKIRYLVDYKEEHTIRRNAIERILKRRSLMGDPQNYGLSLLQELITSGYVPNDGISESVSGDIKTIIDKYLLLGQLAGIDKNKMLSLAASEIERFLYPQHLYDLVVNAFYTTVSPHIFHADPISEDDLHIQTYIGCRRSLLEDDQKTLLYAVILRYIPNLPFTQAEDAIQTIATQFAAVLSVAEKAIEDPLGWKLSAKLRNQSVYFSVLTEIIKRYGGASESIFADHARLEQEIKKILAEKYDQQFNVVRKSGTRAVVYIMLTKVILALALELPYERIFLSSIDYTALGTNILFHPLLLLVMVKTICFPSAQNTAAIISGVASIVDNKDIPEIHIKSTTGTTILTIIYSLLYTLLFVISFGFIIWVLTSLHFNIVSIALFLFFLTFVSYFGFRIRHNSRKWVVSTENENVLTLLWNFFTIPIIRTGRWLSRRFSSINIFVFIMDFILETPFKLVLGTFDSFISFLKEKREDSY